MRIKERIKELVRIEKNDYPPEKIEDWMKKRTREENACLVSLRERKETGYEKRKRNRKKKLCCEL
jgi:hypothetical protein